MVRASVPERGGRGHLGELTIRTSSRAPLASSTRAANFGERADRSAACAGKRSPPHSSATSADAGEERSVERSRASVLGGTERATLTGGAMGVCGLAKKEGAAVAGGVGGALASSLSDTNGVAAGGFSPIFDTQQGRRS